MAIDVVVFPVAGLGSRFLPASKVIPKEMLPIVDVPLIQLAVQEAYRAGIRHVVLVSNTTKQAIYDHFKPHPPLEAMLEARGKTDLLKLIRETLPADMHVDVVYQEQALGLGHAVLCAKGLVAGRDFAVMLPDDLIDGPDAGCLADMMELYTKTAAYSIAVENVPASKTASYGIVSLEQDRIIAVVEKPQPSVAPSTLAVVGRYILPAAIFEMLEKTPPGAGGEIQLTDAIAALLPTQDIRAHRFRGVRYDCGSKLGHLQANIVYALKDAAVADGLRSWLKHELSVC